MVSLIIESLDINKPKIYLLRKYKYKWWILNIYLRLMCKISETNMLLLCMLSLTNWHNFQYKVFI